VANLDLIRALDARLAGAVTDWDVAEDTGEAGELRARARKGRDALPPKAAAAATLAVGGEVPGTRARVLVYTDGGCRGNPGIGGWGSILIDPSGAKARVLVGGEPDSTNNRMEMTAALKALESLTVAGVSVEIRTDSRYLVDVGSKWLAGWKRGGWVKKDGEPLKNLDLVKALDAQIARHKVIWTWVEGHAGEPGNEYVDRLTNEAMDAIQARLSPARDETLTPSPLRLRP
jgi:ribonuclease HI